MRIVYTNSVVKCVYIFKDFEQFAWSKHDSISQFQLHVAVVPNLGLLLRDDQFFAQRNRGVLYFAQKYDLATKYP